MDDTNCKQSLLVLCDSLSDFRDAVHWVSPLDDLPYLLLKNLYIYLLYNI